MFLQGKLFHLRYGIGILKGNCLFKYLASRISGTWFGVEGLVAAGESLSSSDALQRAVGFLLSKQNANGGWGESYLACVNKAYPSDGTGQVL